MPATNRAKPFPPTQDYRRVERPVMVRVARELAGLAAVESTHVGPTAESVVRAAASAVAAASVAAAAWAARAERDRAAVARVVPSMEDRALTPASSPARFVLGWIHRPRATHCAEHRATVQVVSIAGQAPRRRAAVRCLARCNHSRCLTTARTMPTVEPEKCACHRRRKFSAAAS